MILKPDIQDEVSKLWQATLESRVVGQERAIRNMLKGLYLAQAGIARQGRPAQVSLFLGPTGVGKTHAIHSLAYCLCGDASKVVRVNCAEYQHSHEIAKLTGAPPGYVGYREGTPQLSDAMIKEKEIPGLGYTLILFDEVEKAHYDLYQLLLGMLDVGTLRMGSGETVAFNKTIVFFTSNLGGMEISKSLQGHTGFIPEAQTNVYQIAKHAAKKHFSPEFMNRVDRLIVFRPLAETELLTIVRQKVSQMLLDILACPAMPPFELDVTPEAVTFLAHEGYDAAQGARHIHRAVERFLLFPILALARSGQILPASRIQVSLTNGKLEFNQLEEIQCQTPISQ